MNLHETEYGRRFFNSQLPNLIKALERIAESLSAPKQSLSADFVADPDFLHDLYYGDYEPSVFKTQSEHQKQLNHNASMAEELLRQKMGNSPEAMAAFEAYQLAAGECSSIVAEQAFESGFQTAVQMVNALSRYADVQICEACGMDEALRDAAHTPLLLVEWDAVKSGHLKKKAEKSICYLVQNCTFSEVFKHTYKPPMQLIERPVSELAYSRSDYDGYRWWTTWHNESGKKTPPELVKEIDEFQNALFKLPAFKTLETMKRFCRYAGTTSDPTEFNLYSETAHLYIRIRLITRFRDYNAYIYYYDKAAAGEEQ